MGYSCCFVGKFLQLLLTPPKKKKESSRSDQDGDQMFPWRSSCLNLLMSPPKIHNRAMRGIETKETPVCPSTPSTIGIKAALFSYFPSWSEVLIFSVFD